MPTEYLNIPLKETPLGTQKEQVAILPPEVVQHDSAFPKIVLADDSPVDVAKLPALQVVDENPILNTHDSADPGVSVRLMFAEATRFLGRAVFRTLERPVLTVDGRRSLAYIKTKVTGAPKIVRETWADYKGKPPIFRHTPTNPHGDERTDLIKREATVGLGSHLDERQILDAKNSLMLHKRGVKTRLPLAGRFIKKLWFYNEETGQMELKDRNYLKQEGLTEEEIYQSDWLVSCPLTLEDVNDILARTFLETDNNQTQVNTEKLSIFVQALLDLAAQDISPEYQELTKKYTHLVNAEHTRLQAKELLSILMDFGLALSATMGKNYDAMYGNGNNSVSHGALHDQNITFFGEIADNFSVHEGLLEIGLAPENSADLSGLILGLNKYAMLVAKLSRLLEVDNLDQNDLARVFLRSVAEHWPSYDDYIDRVYQQEVHQYIQAHKEELTNMLLLSGISPEDDDFEYWLKDEAKKHVTKPDPFYKHESGYF